MKCSRKKYIWLLVIALLFLGCMAKPALAAPKPKLWPIWEANNPESEATMAHGTWDALLQNCVDSTHPSGINRFKYSSFSEDDKRKLSGYLKKLQEVRVSILNRNEQKAYWINLYNAVTVQVILDHYPVTTIRDIDISPGWFNDGPWDAKLLRIENEDLTLNDVEHRILRPIWKDNRVHYALNCASLGCPNLMPTAFTSANTEALLESGARQFINHPRGVKLEHGRAQVSSIYKWFQVDFGNSEQKVIEHLLQYAEGELARDLKEHNKHLRYDYNWKLNE